MSLAVKYSRSGVLKQQHRGDPGLFGFVGKALGGIAKLAGNILPGPIGLVAKGVGGLLAGNGKPQNPSLAAKPLPASVMPALYPQGQTFAAQPQGDQYGIINIGGSGGGVPQLPYGPGNTTQGGFAGAIPATNGACPTGYHRNKVGYYSKKSGWVAAGSVCVKNRKRNPLNPRALSRSIARLHSAKNAAAFLSRVTIREKC